jgi:hypothetical protein
MKIPIEALSLNIYTTNEAVLQQNKIATGNG